VEKVVKRDPEILGGEPLFARTRVPIESLFDHLEAGDSIADFLEGFPSVKREQVLALLEESKAHAMQEPGDRIQELRARIGATGQISRQGVG
jgi:uncharacterized protein (DUF433 family)